MMLAAASGSLLPGQVCKTPVASHVTLAVFVAGGFVEFEAYTIFGALFKKKKKKNEYEIENTKLGTEVDIYLERE